MQQNSNFLIQNLQVKSERILCAQHRLPIVSLDISPDLLKGERLNCYGCSTIGSTIIYIQKVEDKLNNWLKSFYQLKDSINEYMTLINEKMRKLEKLLNNSFQTIESQSLIFQLVQKLQDETIGASDLQDIGVYLSDQDFRNNQMAFKDQAHQEIYQNVKEDLSIILEAYHHAIDELNKIVKKQVVGTTSESYIQEFQPIIMEEKIEQKEEKFEKFEKDEQDEQCEIIQQIESGQEFNKGAINYKLQNQLDGHKGKIYVVAISNDYEYMASGGEDKAIILWNFPSTQAKLKYTGDKQIQDLIFSSDSKLLAAAQQSIISIFKLSKKKRIKPKINLKGHGDIINRILFTKNSEFIMSGSKDQTFFIWRTINKSNPIRKESLPDSVQGISISEEETFISACCNDGQAFIFECSKIESIKQLVNWKADECIFSTIFTPDSKNVLTSNKSIKVWSIESLLSNQQVPILVIEENNQISCLRFGMGGQILVANLVRSIGIYQMSNGKLIQSLEIPEEDELSVKLSFDVTKNMRRIVIGGNNKKVKIYKLERKLQQN